MIDFDHWYTHILMSNLVQLEPPHFKHTLLQTLQVNSLLVVYIWRIFISIQVTHICFKYGSKLVKEMLKAQCKFVISKTNPNQVGYCVFKMLFQSSSFSWIYISIIHACKSSSCQISWLILKILFQRFHYVGSKEWYCNNFAYGIDTNKVLSNNTFMLKFCINSSTDVISFVSSVKKVKCFSLNDAGSGSLL